MEQAGGQETPPTEEQMAAPRLGISGVVLSKAQLLEALRAYIPGVTDFSPLPDGQHFYLLFGPDGPRPQP